MIKLFNAVLKENLLGSPFAPDKAYGLGIGEVLGIATAAPALFGSIINSSTSRKNNSENVAMQRETNALGAELQRETNQLNADLQRETNMQNQVMFDKSLAWQNEMWQKTNEYNDPKNAVQRMLNAGVNPSVGLGQGGVASAMSAPSAPAMQAAKMEAFKPVAPRNDIAAGQINLDGVFQGAVNAFNQSRLADQSIKESQSRTHGNDIANEFNSQTLVDKVKSLKHMAKIDEANEEFYKNQARLFTASFEARQAVEYGNAELQRKNIELANKSIIAMQLDIDAKQIENAWLPALKADEHNQYLAAINQAKAQVGLILSNTTLTYNQAKHEIIKALGTVLDNGLKGLNYDVVKGTKDSMIQMAESQLKEQNYNNILLGKDIEDYGANWWNRIIQGYIPFASGSATAGTKAYLKVK